MFDCLIRGGLVATMRPDPPSAGAPSDAQALDVAVADGRIAAVEPPGTISPGRAREVLEAAGRLVMPGLVNAHTHLAMTLFRGYADDLPIERWFNERIWPVESRLTPEDVYWGTLLALAESIEAGVTTVADHYFFMDEVARAVEQAGVRALLAWASFGTGDDPAGRFAETVAFCRRWQGAAGGRITTWLGPHAPYTCPPDFLRRVAKTARELGVGCHVHVAETRGQVELSLREHGATPVQVLQETGVLDGPALLAHCIHADEADLDRVAAAGAGVAHCPGCNLKYALGVAPVPAMRARGIAVGLGTDGVASNNNLDVLEEMRLAAAVHKQVSGDPAALPFPEALALATREGARALGMGDRVGTVEVGKAADLILLDLDQPHLVPRHNVLANVAYSARASDVVTVLVAGRVLLRDRRLVTVDRARAMEEVAARARRLAAEATPDRRIQEYRA